LHPLRQSHQARPGDFYRSAAGVDLRHLLDPRGTVPAVEKGSSAAEHAIFIGFGFSLIDPRSAIRQSL